MTRQGTGVFDHGEAELGVGADFFAFSVPAKPFLDSGRCRGGPVARLARSRNCQYAVASDIEYALADLRSALRNGRARAADRGPAPSRLVSK
jgi:hypothetical protein